MADDGWLEVKMFYDQIDMTNNYRRGFWIGAVSGVVGSLVLCLLVGLYINT